MREQLLQLFQRVLQDETLTFEDNFFVAGGDSFAAGRLIQALQDELYGHLNFEDVFAAETFGALADRVSFDRSWLSEQQFDRKAIPVPSEPIPASDQQAGIFLHDQLHRSDAFHLVASAEWSGVLDAVCLEQAWNLVFSAYALFQYWFDMAGEQVVMRKRRHFSVPRIILWQGISAAERLQMLDQMLGWRETETPAILAVDEKRPPADTAAGLPSVRNGTIWLAMHHIYVDEQSFSGLFKDLLTVYARLRSGKPAAAETRDSYLKFAVWQQHFDESDAWQYWQEKWPADAAGVVLPFANVSASPDTGPGILAAVELPATAYDRIRAISRTYGCSYYVLFMGLFKLYLYRLTGQPAVPVGYPISLSALPAFSDAAGLLISQSLCCLPVDTGITFAEFFRRLQTEIAHNLIHGVIPLDQLGRRSGRSGFDPKRPYQIHFNYIVETDPDCPDLHDLTVSALNFLKRGQLSRFELVVGRRGDHWQMGLISQAGYLDSDILSGMADDFRDLIETVLQTDLYEKMDLFQVMEMGDDGFAF